MELDLFSQAGMEDASVRFVRYLHENRPYAVNALLDPKFISCNFERKELVLSFPMQPWMENPAGVMHGGVVSAALDTAMGAHTFYWAREQLTPTISMDVHFVRPVTQGSVLVIRSHVSSCGRTMAYAEATAWLEGHPEKPVATAQGTYSTTASSVPKSADSAVTTDNS